MSTEDLARRAASRIDPAVKGSIAAYRGHMTRLYKELDTLMEEMESVTVVQVKRGSLTRRLFEMYQDLHSNYVLNVSLSAGERENHEKKYQKELHRFQDFNRRYSIWYVAMLPPMEGWTSTPNIEQELAETNSFSLSRIPQQSTYDAELIQNVAAVNAKHRARSEGHVSKKSSHASKASKAQTDVLLAQLKVKQLQEDQRLMEIMQNLKAERDAKAYEAEILRVESKRELFKAKVDAERAELLANSVTGSDKSWMESFATLSDLPKQDPTEKVKTYLESFKSHHLPVDDQESSIWPRLPLHLDTKDYSTTTKFNARNMPRELQNLHLPKANHSDANAGDSSQLYQILEQQQNAMKMLVSGLAKLDMPKREFLTFDGKPIRYHRFVRNFEVHIEDKIEDPDIRLSYLIQYCTGAAKEAIENCVILQPELGYREAREILRKNFGQRHIIIHAFINKVVEGSQLKASEPEKLMQLARDMRNCELNSGQMGYKSDINSMETLTRVVKRLPPHLQARWAEESGKFIEAGGDPTFANLTDCVEKRAAVANTEFGKISGIKTR